MVFTAADDVFSNPLIINTIMMLIVTNLKTCDACIDACPMIWKWRLVQKLNWTVSNTHIAWQRLICTAFGPIPPPKAFVKVPPEITHYAMLAPEHPSYDPEICNAAALCCKQALDLNRDTFKKLWMRGALFKRHGLPQTSQHNVLVRHNDTGVRVFMQILVFNSPPLLQILHPSLRDDAEFIKDAVARKPASLEFATDAMRDTFGVVFAAVEHGENEPVLQFASNGLKADICIVHKALEVNGCNLAHVSPELKKDRAAVMIAVGQNGNAIRFADAFLFDDYDVMHLAVSRGADALYYASPRLKNNEPLVRAAINYSGMALRYASVRLKNDASVALAAIHKNVRILKFLGRRIVYSELIMATAAKRQPCALKYIPHDIKNYKEILMGALQKTGLVIQWAPEECKNDFVTAMKAVTTSPRALEYVGKDMYKNKAIVMAAVSVQAHALQFASPEMQADKEIVTAACMKDSDALNWASANLRKSSSFIQELIDAGCPCLPREGETRNRTRWPLQIHPDDTSSEEEEEEEEESANHANNDDDENEA